MFDWNFVKTCVRSIWESSSTDSQDHPWLAMLIHSSNSSSVLWKVQWLQHTMLKTPIFVQKVDLDQTFFWLSVKFNPPWIQSLTFLSTQKCYFFLFLDKMWTFGIVCWYYYVAWKDYNTLLLRHASMLILYDHKTTTLCLVVKVSLLHLLQELL